jgi:hypothetical protein
MREIKRVYLYLVSFISLMVFVAAASNLIKFLLDMALNVTGPNDYYYSPGGRDAFLRDQLSLWGAMLLVAASVWALHWLLAQRSVSPSNPDAEQERGSVLRKLAIYATLFVTAWTVFVGVKDLFQALFMNLAGLDQRAYNWASPLMQISIYALAWLYYWRVRHADNSLSPEDARGAVVRRLYVYLTAFVALSIFLAATTGVVRTLWDALTAGAASVGSGDGWARSLATQVPFILAGGALWLLHWLWAQRFEEQRSRLRRLYLYGMVLQSVSVTLFCIIDFVHSLLRLLIGTDPLEGTGKPVITGAGDLLLTALIYGLFWIYTWRVLKQDAELVPGDPGLQASLLRVYNYLVALTGLAVLSGGVVMMVRLLLDFWLGGTVTTLVSRQALGDEISLVATLLVIGGGLWAVVWKGLQKRALGPGSELDRLSTARRIYLFIVLFAGIVTLLGSGSWLLYRLLRSIGAGFSPDQIGDISWAAGATLAAAVTLAYHQWVLAGDMRARARLEAAEREQSAEIPRVTQAHTALMLLRSESAQALAETIAALRNSMPDGVQEYDFDASDLTSAELSEWLVSRRQAVAQMKPSVPPASPPAAQQRLEPGSQPISG